MCSVVTQYNILNSNKTQRFGRATTKSIVISSPLEKFKTCHIALFLKSFEFHGWFEGLPALLTTVPALWDVTRGRICPELLRNTTKALVTSTFLREEICAEVLHNNDVGIQNVRPQPSVVTFSLQNSLNIVQWTIQNYWYRYCFITTLQDILTRRGFCYIFMKQHETNISFTANYLPRIINWDYIVQ